MELSGQFIFILFKADKVQQIFFSIYTPHTFKGVYVINVLFLLLSVAIWYHINIVLLYILVKISQDISICMEWSVKSMSK